MSKDKTVFSKTHKQHLSEALKGKPFTKEHIAAIRESKKVFAVRRRAAERLFARMDPEDQARLEAEEYALQTDTLSQEVEDHFKQTEETD